MYRILLTSTLLLVAGRALSADDKPGPQRDAVAGRAEALKAIEAEYRHARDGLLKDIRAGKVKADANGFFRELADLQRDFAKRMRALIDADPKDAAGLDAILFSITELVADADDPSLYRLLEAHHLASPKIAPVMDRPAADEKFLHNVAENSPDPELRGAATLSLAGRFAGADRPGEAETLLEQVLEDKQLAKLHGRAGNLLFEVRHLAVGKEVPEIEGWDLDDKAMKLSEYRGKVVMLVFWATWCAPCMAMLPHERELAKHYADRPFAIVGVNGDDDNGIRKAVEDKLTTWRSFQNYLLKEKRQISARWNVSGWPTVYVLDHRGVIRLRFRGQPADTGPLDKVLEDLVKDAEAERKKSGNPGEKQPPKPSPSKTESRPATQSLRISVG